MRYVDLNPVRAGICAHPADYHWSSYAQKVGLLDGSQHDHWLDPDPVTWHEDKSRRQHAYASFVSAAVPDGETELIRTAVRRNQLTGNGRFIDEIEHRTGLRIEARGQGRPPGK